MVTCLWKVSECVGFIIPTRLDIRASDSCLMLDYVHVINFRIIIIIKMSHFEDNSLQAIDCTAIDNQEQRNKPACTA